MPTKSSSEQRTLGVEANARGVLSSLEQILDCDLDRKSITSLPENELISDSSVEALSDSLNSSLFEELELEPEYIEHEVVPPDKTVDDEATKSSFTTLRATYLLITLVIMLADGLQGTHLYVLYEGYGFSVASLYCLGFVTGGLCSPITGPLVDKLGRKKAAILYCVLEMFINMLEQYPLLWGLIASRMIGGFTTNLLSTVFEAWLDTEYRRRGFDKEKYEIIMRDAVIVSNSAAIFSGYMAHVLAKHYGAVGPFEGAVTCTGIALAVVVFFWSENYGSSEDQDARNMVGYLKEAATAFKNDSKMLRIGVIQGLTMGSIQTFIFLWAPALRTLSESSPAGTWGLDVKGDPAYGLIFGAYMAAGVVGGLVAPYIRRGVSVLLSPIVETADTVETEIEGEGKVKVRPMAVEFLAALCYFVSGLLLLVPWLLSTGRPEAFSRTLVAFLIFEFLIGVFLPCEGVIRSLYFPANARASIMVLPRIIVNVAVSFGVVSTNFVSLWTACAAVAFLLIVSAVLQLSLISTREWKSLFSRVDRSKKFARSFMARSMSCDALRSPLKRSSRILRRLSTFDHDKNPTGESGAGSFVGETIFDKVKRD